MQHQHMNLAPSLLNAVVVPDSLVTKPPGGSLAIAQNNRLAGNGAIAFTVYDPFGLDYLLCAALALRASYSPSGNLINQALNLFGGNRNSFVPNSSSPTPGFAVANYDWGDVVVVSGTSNFGQYLGQALEGGNLVAFQNGRTNAYWASAATALWALISPQLQPYMPCQFVGHSYGAAVAALLAQMHPLFPDGNVDVVGFGTPKIGTLGNQTALEANCRVSLVAGLDDPVVGLPPNLPGGSLLPAAPGTLVTTWGTYAPAAPRSSTLDSKSSFSRGATPTNPGAVGLLFLQALDPLAWLTTTFGYGHQIPTYYTRLRGVQRSGGDLYAEFPPSSARIEAVAAALTAANL